jgi:GntR family transcriptional regulator
MDGYSPAQILSQRLARTDGPLYRQAAEHMRASITGGRLSVGTELPAEAELAAGFGVSLITVRHALRELEAQGLINKRKAKAAIVSANTPRVPLARTLNSLEDVIAATRDARLQIFSFRKQRSTEAAAAFGVDAATPLDCLHGRLYSDEQPISEIFIYFPPQIGVRLTRADFDDVVVFRSVERRLGLKLTGARVTVSADRAGKALARALDCKAGRPVLTMRILYYAGDNAPVELTIARHRADRYRLTYDFR